MIKNHRQETFTLPLERQVKHICSELYKIKGIDRKKEYKLKELKKIVLASKEGKNVIKQLNELKISEYWLRLYDQDLLADVFGKKLEEY